MKYRCSKCRRLYERDSTKAWIKSFCTETYQHARLMRVNAAIVVTEEKLWPVQVSIEEFIMRVEGNEDVAGKPVIWAQWPKEAKPPKS